MNPIVNRWLDLLDRVGWTALQAAAAAGLTYLTTGMDISWQNALAFVGFAALAAALKVIVGQRFGDDDTGSLIGTPVVVPAPTADTPPLKPASTSG